MDTMSSGEAARRLGTTVPRVKRALTSIGIKSERSIGGHIRIEQNDLQALIRALGSAPKIDGLSREATFVLAALGRRPLGLNSGRAVARAAGVSPTTANRGLARLEALGYVEHVEVRVLEGRIIDRDIWQVKWESPAWLGAASTLADVITPERRVRAVPKRTVPKRLHHLFWNSNPRDLDIQRDGKYIAARILVSHDSQALAWMAETLLPEDIRAAASVRGMDVETRALALNLANRP